MSFANKSPSETNKDILIVDNSNNGVDSTVRSVKSGSGTESSVSVSDRSLKVKSVTNNTVALDVQNSGGTSRLAVDTTNDTVKALDNHLNTNYKDFGVYDFSPSIGVHYPMVANNMMFSDSGDDFVGTTDFGSGTDPATTWYASAGTPKIVVASMWRLQGDIYIDQASGLITADDGQHFTFHIYSYDLSVSLGTTGDLSNGTLLAHASSTGALSASEVLIRAITFTIDSASVASGKVIIAFVEGTSGSDDITCNVNLKYHLI